MSGKDKKTCASKGCASPVSKGGVTAPSIPAIPKDVTRRARRVDSVDRTPNRGMILKFEDTILAKIDFYLVWTLQ
jgi:hypothetical protein